MPTPEERIKELEDLVKDLRGEITTEKRLKQEAITAKDTAEKEKADAQAEAAREKKRHEVTLGKLGGYEQADKRKEALAAAKQKLIKDAEAKGVELEIDDAAAEDTFGRLAYNPEKLAEDAVWALGKFVKEKQPEKGTVITGQGKQTEDKAPAADGNKFLRGLGL